MLSELEREVEEEDKLTAMYIRTTYRNLKHHDWSDVVVSEKDKLPTVMPELERK